MTDSDKKSHAGNSKSAASGGQDDATLKEIARQIREGPSENETAPLTCSFIERAQRAANRQEAMDQRQDLEDASVDPMAPQDLDDEQSELGVPIPSRPPFSASPLDTNNGRVDRDQDQQFNDIIAKLGHELRTPLSAIYTAAEILSNEQFGPIGSSRYKDYAEDMRLSAEHALGVINAMLPAYGHRSQEPIMEFTQFDLGELVQHTVSGFQPLADRSGIELHTSYSSTLPLAVADARSIRQIILNLLTNALKFTAPGGLITVTTGHEPGETAWIEISDNGAGMTQEQITAVLSQAGSSGANIRRTETGSGLGLPLCLSLAEANGTTLSLAPARGGGLHATLSFPSDRLIPAW